MLTESYDELVTAFNQAVKSLLDLTPSVTSVELRLKNDLTTFADFAETDLNLDGQVFEDFKSKYLDLHDKVKRERTKDKVSVLEEVDFELVLMHRDEINVAYILNLLREIARTQGETIPNQGSTP